MKPFLLFLLISIQFTVAYSQDRDEIDSLKRVFEGNAPDTIRLDACKTLSLMLSQVDSAATEHYILRGKSLAHRLKNEEAVLHLELYRGYNYYMGWHYDKALSIYQTVLAKSKIKDIKTVTAETFRFLGDLYWYKGKYDTAIHYYEEAVVIYSVLDDDKGLAISLSNIGESYHIQRDYDKAKAFYNNSYVIYKKLGDKNGMAAYFRNLGYIHSYQGNHAEAIDFFDKALKSYEELGINNKVALLLLDLGSIYAQKGQHKKAISNYTQSLKMFEAEGHYLTVAEMLTRIGLLYYNQGNYTQALSYFTCSQEINEENNGRQNLAYVLNHIGNVHNEQGNRSAALSAYKKSLGQFRAIEHKQGVIYPLSNIASIQEDLGNYDSAIFFYNESLKVSEALGDKTNMANDLKRIGLIHLKNYEEDSAFKYFDHAFKYYEENNALRELREAFQSIGSWYESQVQLPKALDFYFDALQISEEVNDTLGMAKVYGQIAGVYQTQKNVNKTLEYLEESLYFYEINHHTSGIAQTKNDLGKLLAEKGEYKLALTYSFQALENYLQLSDSCSLGNCFLTIASTYRSIQKLDSSLYYLDKSIQQAGKCNEATTLAFAYVEIGRVYQQQKQPFAAIESLEKATIHAEKSQNRLALKTASEYLYPLYKATGQMKKALTTFEVYHAYNDSLFSDVITKTIAQKEMQYAYEKKWREKHIINQQKEAQQVQSLARQRWLIYLIAGALLTMVVVIFAFHRSYVNKKNINVILQAKHKEIAKQKAELEELDHVKSRFFANISHELRTPLTLINGPIQGLLNSKEENFTPTELQTLQVIERNSKQLKNLVNDILDLSKLESNKLEVDNDTVAIKALLNRVASYIEDLCTHLGVSYIQYYDQLSNDWLLIDALKLEKILLNLLSNALKHTPSGGKIQLTATREDDRLIIKVSDTGKGISSIDLPFIFERFYQSKQPGAPLLGGTGIGLALAKDFTKLMGGELTVKSEEGKGSTFILNLPYVPVQPPALEKMMLKDEKESVSLAHSKLQPKAGEKHHNVLIVEDNPDMQQFVQGLLNDKYITSLAPNGKAALQILKEEAIDIVISDVMMPEMDGYVLLKHLKDSDKYRNIPVIMLTALYSEGPKLEALTLGVDDYLSKPFSPKELLARVSNLLVRQEARKQWQQEELVPTAPENYNKHNDEDALNISNNEVVWIKAVESVIRKEIENEEFNISKLADQFHLSERQFRRKISKITGLSPKKYQQEIALNMARELLESRRYTNVTAVAYSVGIQHVTRFSRQFEDRFGKKPGEYFEFH
ncbi:tetratricopeptide repeat protein [Fulvivirga sp. 29W222]|uniref:histidine kinase n=1 Tax=Fulvivirga marina TaxID=2494733 RepID=A0A937KCJ9_9BACT|nr:tetratricopeptide repeat protein [Fulvivirga marina]MBL6447602.1 tetratricopeptide repeat protein [Fulvivirga marina]